MAFTIGWIVIGLAAAILEAIALFNSRTGDTLSEHMWVFTGYRDGPWHASRREGYPDEPVNPRPSTPKWTVRLGRTVIIFGMVWMTIHFVSGGWV